MPCSDMHQSVTDAPCCNVVFAVSMASSEVTGVELSEHVQKAPRRRKCKNHLVQLAEMFPDVEYHVAAFYGSSEDQIYVMAVYVDGAVIVFFIFCITIKIRLQYAHLRNTYPKL